MGKGKYGRKYENGKAKGTETRKVRKEREKMERKWKAKV